MNARKASRKAARHSLDGHVRFVVATTRSIEVLDLRAVATTRGSRIDVIAAYSAGKCVTPRKH
ncbi:hypothetical protein Q8F57_003380 [Paraburkholderia terrae]|uniref:hypothetical protein n=1 Tax=Paraburkholderia terrae TaxID=311230 RepID=UPI00296B4401|nr:hypothetical protein [Paraburkholderia terrae]MDW3655432.1 hypothetical protein [Paraburkholderia terrae]